MDENQKRPKACVVGAGPSGLMAAEVMARAGASVTICDQMPSLARKFLMAGRGGLNLTRSQPFETFMAAYGSAAGRLRPLIAAFSPSDLRAWCEALGEPTFIGAGGRIFPASMKASPLLRAWLVRLRSLDVRFAPRHRLEALDKEGSIRFSAPDGETRMEPGAIVLALGGASWPRLGSRGDWAGMLASHGIASAPLRPANVGFELAWSHAFSSRNEGQPIKGVCFSCPGGSSRGEAIVTAYGLEGGGVYELSAFLRDAVEAHGSAALHIDLRPDLTREQVADKLSRARVHDSLSQKLRKAVGLSPVAIGLLREACGPLAREPGDLSGQIKTLSLRLTGVRPIARAISSAGGLRFDEMDEGLMLRRLPGVFACGEMLDWEAPTGGYLLQACFSTGHAAGKSAAAWLGLG